LAIDAQLIPETAYATGARKDKNVAVMKPIVAKLSDREIVAVAA
jgi:cytochrome c553